MPKTPPYFLDGEEITRESFLALDPQRRVTAMKDWFFDMYEDPAHETPHNSREGGYQYIWGGPFDAQEELYENFGDAASEDEIQAAVELIEHDGITDWAPRYPEPDPDPEIEDTQEPAAAFPSSQEMEASRQLVLASLDRVEALVEQERLRLLRMHNWPPEGLDDDPPLPEDAQEAIRDQLAQARALAGSPSPDRAALVEKVGIFRRLGLLVQEHPLLSGLAGALAAGPLGNAGQMIWDSTGGEVLSRRHEIAQALFQAADAVWNWAQHLLPF